MIAGPTARDLTTGDFNADGKLDLAVATNVDGELGRAVILLGNGDGTFQFSKNNVYGTGFFANGIAAGDFNGDGLPDVALPSLATNTLALLKSNGDGSMQYQGFYGAGVQPDAIAMADLNGDNVADVVVANFLSGTISVSVSQPASGPDSLLSVATPVQRIKSRIIWRDAYLQRMHQEPTSGDRERKAKVAFSGMHDKSHQP
jgi:hypothetical protein